MNLIQKFFSNHLPNGVKRLICLSTLGYMLRKPANGVEKRKFVNRINAELNLAEEEGALHFAICFANSVWRETLDVHSEDVQETVRHLYSLLPDYLIYGDEEKMKIDIKSVVLSFS